MHLGDIPHHQAAASDRLSGRHELVRPLLLIGVAARPDRRQIGATLGVIAADRQWLLPLLTTGALVLNLALAFAALASGLGLEGLAATALLGRTVYASTVVVAAARGSGLTDWPALLARTLLPLVWCAGVVGVLGHLMPAAGGIGAVAALAAYLVALLPLVPFGRVALREFRASASSEAGHP